MKDVPDAIREKLQLVQYSKEGEDKNSAARGEKQSQLLQMAAGFKLLKWKHPMFQVQF